MDSGFLSLIFALSFMGSLFTGLVFLFELCDGQKEKSLVLARWISWTSMILTFVWLYGALSQPLKIRRELMLTPAVMHNDDGSLVQIVTYTDQHGKQVIVNLNEKFKGYLPEKSRIKVTEYREEWYCGVSFEDQNHSQPTYKIVKD
jgi:hypothetical protein